MDRPIRIMVIDDEETMLRILRRAMEPEGYIVETFSKGLDAMARLKNSDPPDVVVTDMKLPDDIDGFSIIEATRTIDKNIPVVVITAYSSVESAVAAVKAGAYDFIPKPFDPEQILFVVRRAAEARSLRIENLGLKRRLAERSSEREIIGASPAMNHVFEMIKKVKDTDGTVLIIGESGVGKELVARAIHSSGKRAEHPFIPINCGALPDDLLESELFGHEKGAFTGAVTRKKGLFEVADRGTVFLDEVSSISPMMQVKLLRFLQERNFMRLGGSEVIAVDVRVIAATNEDLKNVVSRGAFRKDLYYRLNVIPIEIPPLRERRDDIPLLVRHFMERYARKTGKKITGIAKDAEDALLKHDWEGNVRELENVIERAVTITNNEVIDMDDIPLEVKSDNIHRTAEGPLPYQPTLSLLEVERLHIEAVLKSVNNNKSKAARILGIDYSTLLRKLKTITPLV